MTRRHSDSGYDNELSELRERLLLMGARVEEMVDGSVRAFLKRDTNLAEHIISLDPGIDQLESEIDERCLRILARWQPVASDLRFVTTALKVVTYLERTGDLAETICRRSVELNREPPLAVSRPFVRMAELAPDMLRDSLDAFVASDTVRAEAVISRDRDLDACYAQCFPELMQIMSADATQIDRATRLSSISKALERVGDQATNIAEMVVFMVAGRQVRHDSLLRDAGASSGVTPLGKPG